MLHEPFVCSKGKLFFGDDPQGGSTVEVAEVTESAFSTAGDSTIADPSKTPDALTSSGEDFKTAVVTVGLFSADSFVPELSRFFFLAL